MKIIQFFFAALFNYLVYPRILKFPKLLYIVLTPLPGYKLFNRYFKILLLLVFIYGSLLSAFIKCALELLFYSLL